MDLGAKMYNQISVNKFIGLNSNVDPSLIEDGEARDILNLRHEKLGKLVTRNGQSWALFVSNRDTFSDQSITLQSQLDELASRVIGDHPIDNNSGTMPPQNVDPVTHEPLPNSTCTAIDANNYVIQGFMNSRGIVGIGEMVLDTEWEELGTDRFMIYAVRTYYQWSDRALMAYLFSPLTGKYKDMLLFPQELVDTERESLIVNSDKIGISVFFDPHPQGSSMYHAIMAPNKVEEPNGDTWIDQGIDINQYRYKVIISDRINGDMNISDAANLAANYGEEKSRHSLHLAANCLDTFNVDDIYLDNRFESGAENDLTKGVTYGMALYRFKTQKSTSMASKAGIVLDKTPQGTPSVYTCDTKLNPVFSTETESSIFNDLMKPIEFELEEYYDDRGVKKYQRAANVFVWQECQLQYYPSTGKKPLPWLYKDGKFDPTEDNNYYLTADDRGFTKTNPLVPKVINLNEHKDIDKFFPLGVWKYRFVWDFGNGVYSAPSTELLCPDIMWSATPTPDETIHTGYDEVFKPNIDNLGAITDRDYSRFVEISSTMSHSKWFNNPGYVDPLAPTDWSAINGSLFGNTSQALAGSDQPIYPVIIDNSGGLSSFGQAVLDVKTKLLGADHYYNRTISGQYRQLPLMYRIISDGDIELKGDFIRNPAGETAPLVLRNLNGDRTYNTCNWFSALLHPYGGMNVALELDVSASIGGRPIDALFGNLIGKRIALRFAPYKSIFNWVAMDKETRYSFLYTQPNIPAEVKDRLIMSGHVQLSRTFKASKDMTDWSAAGLKWENNGIVPFCYSDAPSDPEPSSLADGVNHFVNSKLCNRYPADALCTGSNSNVYGATNFSVNALLPAERLLIVEQLTSYFPSSLLFRAPRIAISIDRAKVPPRAKKLLIFRTKATHTNDYNNLTFGLVAEKDVVNDSKFTDVLIDGQTKSFHYFFDDIQDEALDFNIQPMDFEGITVPLASRFNEALNERMWYANAKRSFSAQPPKGLGDKSDVITISTADVISIYTGAYNPADKFALDDVRSGTGNAKAILASDPFTMLPGLDTLNWNKIPSKGNSLTSVQINTDAVKVSSNGFFVPVVRSLADLDNCVITAPKDVANVPDYASSSMPGPLRRPQMAKGVCSTEFTGWYLSIPGATPTWEAFTSGEETITFAYDAVTKDLTIKSATSQHILNAPKSLYLVARYNDKSVGVISDFAYNGKATQGEGGYNEEHLLAGNAYRKHIPSLIGYSEKIIKYNSSTMKDRLSYTLREGETYSGQSKDLKKIDRNIIGQPRDVYNGTWSKDGYLAFELGQANLSTSKDDIYYGVIGKREGIGNTGTISVGGQGIIDPLLRDYDIVQWCNVWNTMKLTRDDVVIIDHTYCQPYVNAFPMTNNGLDDDSIEHYGSRYNLSGWRAPRRITGSLYGQGYLPDISDAKREKSHKLSEDSEPGVKTQYDLSIFANQQLPDGDYKPLHAIKSMYVPRGCKMTFYAKDLDTGQSVNTEYKAEPNLYPFGRVVLFRPDTLRDFVGAVGDEHWTTLGWEPNPVVEFDWKYQPAFHDVVNNRPNSYYDVLPLDFQYSFKLEVL